MDGQLPVGFVLGACRIVPSHRDHVGPSGSGSGSKPDYGAKPGQAIQSLACPKRTSTGVCVAMGGDGCDTRTHTHMSVMNDSDAARVAMADPVPVRREV